MIKSTNLDGDHDGKTLSHTAVISHNAENMVVAPLVIKRLGVADGALGVDDERLVGGEDLILADVPELRGAVAVRGLHANDLIVQAALVHLPHVARLGERRGVFVHVAYRDVHRRAETTRIYFSFRATSRQKLSSTQCYELRNKSCYIVTNVLMKIGCLRVNNA